MSIISNLRTKLFFASITITLLSACQKDGAIGPTGPTGPTGPSGTSGTFKMIKDSINLASSDWVTVSSNVYQYTYTNNKITQDVVSNAMMQVESWYPSSGGYWVIWPLAIGNAQYLYYLKLNKIILQANASIPPITSFKFVIIPQ